VEGVVRPHADELLDRPAEHRGGRRIDVGDPPVRVGGVQALDHGGGDGLQVVAGGRGLVPGGLELRHVMDGRDEPGLAVGPLDAGDRDIGGEVHAIATGHTDTSL